MQAKAVSTKDEWFKKHDIFMKSISDLKTSYADISFNGTKRPDSFSAKDFFILNDSGFIIGLNLWAVGSGSNFFDDEKKLSNYINSNNKIFGSVKFISFVGLPISFEKVYTMFHFLPNLEKIYVKETKIELETYLSIKRNYPRIDIDTENFRVPLPNTQPLDLKWHQDYSKS